MKVLFIGDVVGRPGRDALRNHLSHIVESRGIELCVVNAENSASGNGITPRLAAELFTLQIDVLTSGNHIFDKREILPYFEHEPRLLRPANYPPGAPGRGIWIGTARSGIPYAVMNIQGRVFMPAIDCPFRVCEGLLSSLPQDVKVTIVDFHGEATAEKQAFARYFDGRISVVVGTHTHVTTADEEIFPGGTAFISDVGMTGPHDSIIGVDKEIIVSKFLNQLPARFETATGDVRINGVELEIEPETGRALQIRRFRMDVRETDAGT